MHVKTSLNFNDPDLDEDLQESRKNIKNEAGATEKHYDSYACLLYTSRCV